MRDDSTTVFHYLKEHHVSDRKEKIDLDFDWLYVLNYCTLFLLCESSCQHTEEDTSLKLSLVQGNTNR